MCFSKQLQAVAADMHWLLLNLAALHAKHDTGSCKGVDDRLTEAAKPINTVLYLYEQAESTLASWEQNDMTSWKVLVFVKRTINFTSLLPARSQGMLTSQSLLPAGVCCEALFFQACNALMRQTLA